jgi:hypothetical protein
MPKAYHFTDWDDLYENNKSREIETLSYFMQPNKLVGEGIGFLRQEPDWLELYGTLGFLKILASQSRRKFRGWLVKSDTPLDASRISALTAIPRDKVQRALDFFSSAPMDWLEFVDMPTGKRHADGTATTGKRHSDGNTSTPAQVPTKCRPSADVFSGGLTDRSSTEEEERERENKLREDQRRQFAAVGARIAELQSISEQDRTEEQDEELKKMRGLRRKIQKKQAAGDFTPVEATK